MLREYPKQIQLTVICLMHKVLLHSTNHSIHSTEIYLCSLPMSAQKQLEHLSPKSCILISLVLVGVIIFDFKTSLHSERF